MTHDELLAKINVELATDYADASGNFPMGLTALRAVVELHKPAKSNRMNDICEVCILPIQDGAFMHREYPCPTICAIEEQLK